MDFKTVKNKIREKKFDPLYFFFGDEDYLIDILITLIREKVVDPQTKDFNYDFLYGDDVNGQDIINIALSLPMMTDYRLVILKSVQKLSPSDRKILERYLDSPANTTVLVLTANKIDRRKKFYANLVKKSIWVECNPIYEKTAISWIIKEFKKHKVEISRTAASLMVELAGTSLRSLHNEIEKIITYIQEKKSVDEKDISQVVGIYGNYNLWDLTDAVGNKDNHLAYKILVNFLEEGISPPLLLMELTRRILLLMKIRLMLEQGMNRHAIQNVIHFNNYFLNLYLNQANNFTLSELRKGLQALQIADRYLKTGYIKPEMVLTLIIHDLIKLGSGIIFHK